MSVRIIISSDFQHQWLLIECGLITAHQNTFPDGWFCEYTDIFKHDCFCNRAVRVCREAEVLVFMAILSKKMRNPLSDDIFGKDTTSLIRIINLENIIQREKRIYAANKY